jgi:NAD(P)-dependent dehydrogenase (short-subunit alcohol dehydrogenase family)
MVNTDMIHHEAIYRLFVPESEDSDEEPNRENAESRYKSMHSIPVPYVEPEDVSEAMVYLCSPGARYVTGETLAVAAGQNAANAG